MLWGCKGVIALHVCVVLCILFFLLEGGALVFCVSVYWCVGVLIRVCRGSDLC